MYAKCYFFRTKLTQDAVIKVFGISFKDYLEGLIKSTMASNASKVLPFTPLGATLLIHCDKCIYFLSVCFKSTFKRHHFNNIVLSTYKSNEYHYQLWGIY